MLELQVPCLLQRHPNQFEKGKKDGPSLGIKDVSKISRGGALTSVLTSVIIDDDISHEDEVLHENMVQTLDRDQAHGDDTYSYNCLREKRIRMQSASCTSKWSSACAVHQAEMRLRTAAGKKGERTKRISMTHIPYDGRLMRNAMSHSCSTVVKRASRITIPSHKALHSPSTPLVTRGGHISLEP